MIEERGVSPEIILYLENPPSVSDLKSLLKKLGIDARALLRKGEQDYKDNNLNDLSLTDDELIKKMTQFPKLIERPIVINGQRAVLGRPPENVLDLL